MSNDTWCFENENECQCKKKKPKTKKIEYVDETRFTIFLYIMCINNSVEEML